MDMHYVWLRCCSKNKIFQENMFSLSLFSLLISVILIFYSSDVVTTETCESPQFLVLYQTGVVNCDFDEDFFSVLWFNTTNVLENDPILDYQDTIIAGVGYESGEFDVFPNGSLIINRVTPQHQFFTVAYLQTKSDAPIFLPIQVVCVAKPDIEFPVINLCGNDSKYCYSKIDSSSVKCSVSKVPPEVMVNLLARTIGGDKNISSELSFNTDSVRYTSSVTSVNVFHFSPHLVLLVCKASGTQGILKSNESMILVQNSGTGSVRNIVTVTYFVYNGTLKLNCTDKNLGFFVWEKVDTSNASKSEMLLWSVFIGEKVTEINAEDVSVDGQGSLVIHQTHVKHEGRYACTYGNGMIDGAVFYDVNVVVPAYPVIDGCKQQQHCVMTAKYEGILRCSVTGVRPQIQLRWQTFFDGDASSIIFTNNNLVITKGDYTFDVTLVSKYSVTDKSQDKVTVECKVVASQIQLLELTMKVDLLFEEGTILPTNQTSSPLFLISGIAVLVCCSLILVLVMRVIIKKSKQRNTKQARNMNALKMPLNFSGYRLASYECLEMKQTFLKQVRERYKDLYNAVQPVPFVKDKCYNVNRIFVEGGIECLISSAGGKEQVKEPWAPLDSYQNVFNCCQIEKSRCVLEGEPGYGKSIITLQFAYDWCNSIPTSPLRDVEILVLLRLRQLSGVLSIYKAIKQFLLPRDSILSENDIERILQLSDSVVIIFDGFDEYPDRDCSASDVISIITRKMFVDCGVLVTTRPSLVPNKYNPLTRRLRLTGYDEDARRHYIHKVVVGDDDDRVRQVEKYLKENSFLSDLSQVPLFFAMFAHMTYESEKFRKLNSLTSFFRYIISCLHSHMRNKMDNENVRKYELFESDHSGLDKLAFEALSLKCQQIVWEKEEFSQAVGSQFCEYYRDIGILIEEEVIRIDDDPFVPITKHVQYETEVRFYHKLFCEWYAAHYLTDYIEQNPDLDVNVFLQHLDPIDAQYVYRFACGLNSYSADKVIKYLRDIEVGDAFATLCILEHTMKIENIKDTISRLCFDGVVISACDNLLLQRSYMRLLEIAARDGIPITLILLHNCILSVDRPATTIRTHTGFSVTSTMPVIELGVSACIQEITEDEYLGMLRFASMCSSLNTLWFWGNPPPRSFKDRSTLSTLYSRNVKVKCYREFERSPKYILNLLTGRWEREEDSAECTDEDFEKMRVDWTRIKNPGDDETQPDEGYVEQTGIKQNLKQKKTINVRQMEAVKF